MARRLLDACGWLRQAFLQPEGYFLPFTAWKILLTAGDTQLVGVITECYAWPEEKEPSLEKLVMHQLEWLELINAEKAAGSSVDWQETGQLLCKNGERILTKALEIGADTTAPLWQQYQQALLQIV